MFSNIVWDKTEYSLKKLAKLGSSSLPLIIRLTEGYEGIDEYLVYSCDDVYVVVNIEVQSMMILKDSNGRYLSFPINSEVCFYHQSAGAAVFKTNDLLKLQRGSVVRLMEQQSILECFNVKSRKSGTEKILSPQKLGPLVIQDVYENRLLQCHSVIGMDELDETVHWMPLYMPFNVVVANDVTSTSKLNFRQLINKIQSVEGALLKKYEPFNKIIIFDKLPIDKNDYEFIHPETVCYLNSIIFNSSTSSEYQRDEDDEDYNFVDPKASIRRPAKPPAPPPVRSLSYQPRYNQSNEPKQIISETSIITDLPAIKPKINTSNMSSDIPVKKEAAINKNGNKLNSAPITPIRPLLNAQICSNLNKPLPLSASPQTDQLPDNSALLAKPPNLFTEELENNLKEIKKLEHVNASKLAKSTVRIKSTSVVTPFLHETSEHKDSGSTSTPKASDANKSINALSSEWSELGEVPLDISCMSITDVARILRLMNIEEAKIATFIDNDVDGKLLQSLDAHILSHEFRLNKLESLKLSKFTHEKWRPLKDSKNKLQTY